MKNWYVVLIVVFIVGTGLILFSQKQVDAVAPKGLVILHCEFDKTNGDIKVKNFSRSGSSEPSVNINSPCAEALQLFLGKNYGLVTSLTNNSDSFNYTLTRQ